MNLITTRSQNIEKAAAVAASPTIDVSNHSGRLELTSGGSTKVVKVIIHQRTSIDEQIDSGF